MKHLKVFEEMKSNTTITEKEFKKIFKLSAGYSVPKSTIEQYIKYIEGSYLLYKELVNIKDKKFSMTFRNEKIKLQANWDRSSSVSYQDWLMSICSPPRIEVCYFHKFRKEFFPFWAQGSIFEDFVTKRKDTDAAISAAYEEFTHHILLKLKSDYQFKYRVELKYRNVGKDAYRGSYSHAVDMMSPIWLDGVKFMQDLEFKNPKGTYEYITDYGIRDSITNQNNIWSGDLHEPIQRIIDSIKII